MSLVRDMNNLSCKLIVTVRKNVVASVKTLHNDFSDHAMF